MHSSRMRTIRNSSRLLTGGVRGCLTPPPQEQAPPGSIHPPGSSPQSRHPPGAGTPLQILLNFPLGYGPGPDPPQLPPWLWTWTRSPSTSPLAVGLDQISLNFPLGCGPGRPPPPPPDPPKLPPWLWAWKPARHAGIPPPPPPPVDRQTPVKTTFATSLRTVDI